MSVLQWLPLVQADEILETWVCRYERDAARRSQLASIARRYVLDERFLAACMRRPFLQLATPPIESAVDVEPSLPAGWPDLSRDDLGERRRSFTLWYWAMAPCWLAVRPCLRRTLMIEIHLWLAADVVGSLDGAPPRATAADLSEDGDLGRALTILIPAHELADWRPWLRFVFVHLRRALGRPAAARDERWARGLFLIPYSIPAPRPRHSAPAVLAPSKR